MIATIYFNMVLYIFQKVISNNNYSLFIYNLSLCLLRQECKDINKTSNQWYFTFASILERSLIEWTIQCLPVGAIIYHFNKIGL